MSSYEKIYQSWKNNPQDFWQEAAREIHWFKECEEVLDETNAPLYQWFKGAKTNNPEMVNKAVRLLEGLL